VSLITDLYDMSDLSDLAGLKLPFDINEVMPQCVACLRRQLHKFRNAIDENSKPLHNRFIIDCVGVPKTLLAPKLKTIFSPEEWAQAQELMDPVLWAQNWLVHPDGSPWIARPYQAEVMRCTSPRRALRISRRTGKTDVVSVEIVFHAFTQGDQRILVTAPQKIHTEEIFNRVRGFIHRNPLLSQSVEHDISSPIYKIEISNKSTISGFALGARGKTEGLAVRGQNADRIYIDEMDYADEKAIIGGLFPIMQTTAKVYFTGFSTPTGFKSIYYKICEDDPKYREFHYNYKVLPHWKEVEKDKVNYTELDWCHEMLAEWGESEEGVYKPSYIDKALRAYSYKDQMITGPVHGWRYVIGADWNEKHGAEICVIGQNISGGYFQVVDLRSVEKSEFTQISSVQALVEMNQRWRPEKIYVDAGNGSTNFELLKKMSLQERKAGGNRITARILDILKKYDSGASIVSRDPVTHEARKAPAKPYMVNASIRAFEQGFIRISSEDKILESQFRNYIIQRISPSGTPVYGMRDKSVQDHRLDAFNLAMVGFYIEFGWLKADHVITQAVAAPSPRQIASKGAVVDDRTKDLGDKRPNVSEDSSSPFSPLIGAYLPARTDIGNKLASNRPGWAYDMEIQEEAKYNQRRRSKMRGSHRSGLRTNI